MGFQIRSIFAQCLLPEGKYLSLQLEMGEAVGEKCCCFRVCLVCTQSKKVVKVKWCERNRKTAHPVELCRLRMELYKAGQHHPPTQFFLRPSGKLPGGTLWLLSLPCHLPLQKSVTPSSSLQEGITCFWTALCLPFRGLKRPTCLRLSTQLRCCLLYTSPSPRD